MSEVDAVKPCKEKRRTNTQWVGKIEERAMEQIDLGNIQIQRKVDCDLRTNKVYTVNTVLFLGGEVGMICRNSLPVLFLKKYFLKMTS